MYKWYVRTYIILIIVLFDQTKYWYTCLRLTYVSKYVWFLLYLNGSYHIPVNKKNYYGISIMYDTYINNCTVLFLRKIQFYATYSYLFRKIFDYDVQVRTYSKKRQFCFTSTFYSFVLEYVRKIVPVR